MKSETRYNTIFIVALLAISLPGIAMLVRKKLNQPPRESRGALAAPVRTQVAYTDPLPKGPRLAVVVPPLTRQWVAAQSPLVAQLPADVVLSSDGRSFELIGLQAGEAGLEAQLLLWDPRLTTPPEDLRILLRDGKGTRDGVIRGPIPLPLPETVLEELRNSGHVMPPLQVWRAEVTFDGAAATGDLRLLVRGGGGAIEDTLNLATLPAGVRP